MTTNPAITAQRAALDGLDLNRETLRVIRFFKERFQNGPTQDANRDQLVESTGMSVQAASGRTSDAEREGIIYKTGSRRGGQSCYLYEPNPAKWPGRASDYRNTRRFKRANGFLDEFGTDMDPDLRKAFTAFAGQNLIG